MTGLQLCTAFICAPAHHCWLALTAHTAATRKLARGTVQMLDVTLPFNEVDLLEQNQQYLQRACNLGAAPLQVHQHHVTQDAPPVPGPGAQPLPGKPALRVHSRPLSQSTT